MWGAIARGVGGALVGEVAVNLALNTKGFNKDVNNTIKGTEKSFGSAFGKIGKMAAAAFSAKMVWDFGKASVDAASQAQSAWTGLYSIVDGTGKSFANAKGFIEEYISDGLVPLANATTAYKNLAARGYTEEQIEGTLTALKDAAAFGRQASYSLGDAITSATEGLKNENSILVDNAGVTKNVAKMWDEYAESIGTTANNLTQAQKIQAEYNGIMEETKFQTGDAATYANTFAGRTAQLSTAFLNLKTAVGKVIAPIASTFIPVIISAMNALTKFFNKIQQVLSVFGFKFQDVVTKNSSGISGIGESASSTADKVGSIGDSAEKTAKKMKRALGSMDELNILNTSNTSGGSGGSGSGAGGIGDLGSSGLGSAIDNTITEDPISPHIQKIADKIKTYLEPLQKIKLDNLSKAFDKLKKSLKPITKKLLEGLDWLWFEILVPMTKWTIEDAAPAFINALAGALDFFNGVMDVTKPYLQYMWEEFLQPIAKWTGGVIVKVLGWIGDKLSVIGKWLSDNAPKIEDVRKKLDPFTNLLKQIGTFLGKILGLAWNGFSKVLEGLWKYALKPIWEYLLQPILTTFWSKISGLASILGGIFEAFNKIMEGDWKGAGKSIFNGLVDGLKEIWEGSLVKKYLYDPIVGGFKKLFGINSPSTVFIEFGKDIMRGLGNGLIAMKDWVIGKWNTVKSWFTEIKVKVSTWFATKKEDVTNWWNNVKAWWGEKALSVKNKFETAKATVSGWWNSIQTWWGDRTLSIKAKISDVTANLKSWINTNFIDKVNKKLPSWMGKIPRLAQGGWVAANNPQLALIGDNKHEGEIVTPESKIYDQVSKAIKDNGGAGTQQLEITIYHKYEDGRTVIQKINQAQIDAGEVLLLT